MCGFSALWPVIADRKSCFHAEEPSFCGMQRVVRAPLGSRTMSSDGSVLASSCCSKAPPRRGTPKEELASAASILMVYIKDYIEGNLAIGGH